MYINFLSRFASHFTYISALCRVSYLFLGQVLAPDYLRKMPKSFRQRFSVLLMSVGFL